MCQYIQQQENIIEGLINDIKNLSSQNAELMIRLKILKTENELLRRKLEQLESCREN
ncbi:MULTISPECIES: hypothetical protein [Caloramator]|jgi:regulator of replication initiation timing|uniref:Uncharacterized protein n=2 Tax=Caloramator TaxID=44258 RepID=I7KTG8_9CLOT|nr:MULTISPECIES: hypothetical protein [Caloramator]CCJ33058.1 hypothetical protein CAAU_0974 [Caloramator australicus RC3]SEG10019.1 hypothetical protein SAMN05660865_01734 [Caloramator fervidus]